MAGYWLYGTQQGDFRIMQACVAQKECFVVLYENEALGTCASAEAALQRLTCGAIHTPVCGLDIGKLALPTNLTDWIFAPAPKGSVDGLPTMAVGVRA